MKTRQIYVIADEIQRDWKNVNYAAEPYLRVMHALEDTNSCYGWDSADSIIRYFLCNAGTWRGDVARRIKKELKIMIR